MNKVFIEVSEDGRRIEVWFNYDPMIIDRMKTQVSGATFVPKEKSYNGAAHWTIPLDIESCRQLRRVFGDNLQLGEGVKTWGQAAVRHERGLRSLANSDTARLKRLPEVLPTLYEAIHLGPLGRWMSESERAKALKADPSFQAADVAYMAHADNPLNGNHPGLGKTPETIASIFEAGLDDGPILVVAPKSALETTWLTELEMWQPNPVYVSTGSKAKKEAALARFEDEIIFPGFAGWLVVNPDQVRFREDFQTCSYHTGLGLDPKMKKEIKNCPQCKVDLVSEFPLLHNTNWNAIIIDECHKNAVRNPKTLTAKGMFALNGKKRIALTGTPMGGKIINLWGILHYLNPDSFRSKWRWADMWTDVSEDGYGKTIGDSIKHCPAHFGWDDEEKGRPEGCVRCSEIEEAFYNMLAPYMTRRTKKEALPWLPAKQFVPLWLDFSSDKHRKQYLEFAEESQTMIDETPITAIGILDEYTRLKQFSFGYHVRRESDDKLIPTTDSPKLEVLQGKLEELGIWDGSTGEQAVIFSQFSEVVDLIHGWLIENGIPASKITGAISGSKKRREIKEDFQSGEGARVVVMTTTAGGVSITLDRASNVFIMDETWDPDDQEQAEDRCHRASRIHQVTVYYLRLKGSIEETIADTTGTKFARNVRVLDARRFKQKESV